MDTDHNPSRAPPMPRGTKRPATNPPPSAVRKDEPAAELDLAIDEIAPTTNLKEGFTGQER